LTDVRASSSVLLGCHKCNFFDIKIASMPCQDNTRRCSGISPGDLNNLIHTQYHHNNLSHEGIWGPPSCEGLLCWCCKFNIFLSLVVYLFSYNLWDLPVEVGGGDTLKLPI
jgi:hypothetical protein